ncbi:hypothetical protein J6590_003892 [Homalodisca vitripennis]|nr:hypothetical protein J6590_003892 [Homalodisca vitripennis]
MPRGKSLHLITPSSLTKIEIGVQAVKYCENYSQLQTRKESALNYSVITDKGSSPDIHSPRLTTTTSGVGTINGNIRCIGWHTAPRFYLVTVPACGLSCLWFREWQLEYNQSSAHRDEAMGCPHRSYTRARNIQVLYLFAPRRPQMHVDKPRKLRHPLPFTNTDESEPEVAVIHDNLHLPRLIKHPSPDSLCDSARDQLRRETPIESTCPESSPKSNFPSFALRSANSNDGPAVLLDASFLEEVDCSKFLGIFLDRGLTLNYHIDHPNTAPLLMTAYYGLIYPQLTYGMVLWGASANHQYFRAFKL